MEKFNTKTLKYINRESKKEFTIKKEIDSQAVKKLILIEFNNIKNICKKENNICLWPRQKRQMSKENINYIKIR